MSCGVDRRCSWDCVLLRLWCRLAAVGPIQPLAWEPSYALGAGLKKQNKKKKKKKRKEKKRKKKKREEKVALWTIIFIQTSFYFPA